jgi:putative oxidoreductase
MQKQAIRFLAIGLGILLLFHGVDKIIHGISGIESMLSNMNVPYAKYVAYGVYVSEIVAPLLLIFNHYVRIASLLVSLNMIVAIVLGHRETLLTLNNHGAWSIETPLLYLVIAMTLFLLNQPLKFK